MLRIIFWVVIVVLFMSFFGVSIQGLIENPTTQTNFDFILGLVREGLDTIWNALMSVVTAIEETISGLIS